jgi:hypothetical protein
MQKRLTYANVMATVAVFIAMGGAGYAATQLPKNSVGSKQLKKNAVTTAKIKDGAVKGSKIDLSSLGIVPKAATADSAGNAQTLQGLTPAQLSAASKSSCPAGTIFSAGLCFESVARPAMEYVDALDACAAAGRVLPSVSELVTFDRLSLPAAAAEWAGDLFRNGGNFEAPYVGAAKAIFEPGAKEIGKSVAFRCAVAPSN